MNKPIKVFRNGSLKLTVWKNEVEYNGVKKNLFTGNIVKVYKDKEDKWQETKSIESKDFANASVLFNQAVLMGVKVEDNN